MESSLDYNRNKSNINLTGDDTADQCLGKALSRVTGKQINDLESNPVETMRKQPRERG